MAGEENEREESGAALGGGEDGSGGGIGLEGGARSQGGERETHRSQ